MIELISKENKKKLTGKAEFSGRFLKEKFHVSPGKVEEILRFSQGKGKLLFTFSKDLFSVEMPKILELKDEYTRKSGHTPDNVSEYKEVDTKEVEIDKNILCDSEKFDLQFPEIFNNKIWSAYPKEGRIRKKESLRHCKASIKCQEDVERCLIGINNYVYELGEDWKRGFPRKYLNAATFFNDWQQWADKGPNKYMTAEEKAARSKQNEESLKTEVAEFLLWIEELKTDNEFLGAAKTINQTRASCFSRQVSGYDSPWAKEAKIKLEEIANE